MLMLFKGRYIDPTKVVKLSAGMGNWTYPPNSKRTCHPTIWIALGGKDYIHFPAKATYIHDTPIKEQDINWNEICADELAEIAQELNSLLKATKCKN